MNLTEYARQASLSQFYIDRFLQAEARIRVDAPPLAERVRVLEQEVRELRQALNPRREA